MHIFIFDLVCAIVIAVVDLAFPQFLRFCTNDFFTQEPRVIINSLIPIAAFLILLYLIRSGAQYFVTRWGHYMGVDMEADMRADLFYQYQALSFSYYDKHSSGDLISRMLTDLFDISEFAHHGPEILLICGLKIVGSFVLLCFINVPLSLILFGVTAIMVFIAVKLNLKVKAAFRENRVVNGKMSTQLNDSLGGIKTVKSFGNENQEINKFKKVNKKYVNTRKRTYDSMSMLFSSNSMFMGILYTITIVGGGYFVAKGTLGLNELAIFAIYIGIFINPIEVLINFTETFQKAYAGLKRTLEVLSTQPDVREKDDAIDLTNNYDISYTDVDFSYEDKPTIQNLNLSVGQGERIALVGPSGEGKTTICALLPRFYDVDSGCIKIGGIDVRDATFSSLRETIGLVQQDVYMFNTNIFENIAYAKPDATYEEVVEAARAACIHDFIESLDEGYDTFVGERGTRLSGGQKQRIAIARLFLCNPKIVILDEATSALDNESEGLVQQSLDNLCENRTTIIIAHRLSTIKSVDKIAVIIGGSVSEYGTHEELLERGGTYANYYKMQFQK
ncbi:MAG: ABC transporter ATP-binding protein [Coriobacteriia bacterium]|nr:ABC transporter ATP-binding protein [Coriobacteriia bacterium]